MKNRSRCFRVLVATVSLTMVPPLIAEEVPDGDDMTDPSVYPENTPAYQWQEQNDNERLPALPKPENLIPFAVSTVGYDNYRYAVDAASLSIGENDGVRRYTVVITSTSGVRNLRYEGIRCESGEYKTYAYALGNGGFRAHSTSRWQNITKVGGDRYRYVLYDEFYCRDLNTITTLADILQTLRYPPDIDPGDSE